MITAGTQIPNLPLLDSSGEPRRFADYAAERGVLAFFMRTTTCPICNAHVRDLARNAQDFAARGVAVLVVVPEEPEAAAAWKQRRGVPFPVATGASGTAHEAVGLTRRVFGSMQQSGALLIDHDGLVRYAHASTLPTGSYDRSAIMRSIAELAEVATS